MREEKSVSASRTYSPSDFREPATARMARRLNRLAFDFGLRGVPFAVNGILRRRFWIRRNKLWEYARGLAFLDACGCAARLTDNAAPRILDFGGAATIPLYYLAGAGCEVLCLDIDRALAESTNRTAARFAWPLRASTHNIVELPPKPEWGVFDAVISFSVLEHIRKAAQPALLGTLSGMLKPGGVFALTFDFGTYAPQRDAVRSSKEIEQLIAASGLALAHDAPFHDSGDRFALDRRFPKQRFTFASLFLKKQ